jgi:hypothetical protein
MITYHHQQSQIATAQGLTNVHFLSVGVDITALIKQILDGLIARKHDETLGAKHETVHGSVFTSPFFKLEMDVFRGHLGSERDRTVSMRSRAHSNLTAHLMDVP